MNLTKLNTIACEQGAIRAVRFNVDGSYCITCGSDKKLKLWNPFRGLYLKTYGGHGNDVLDACASSDSSQIISCSSDKTAILWDVPSGQVVRRFRGHAGAVSCVKFNEDSSMAVSGGRDNTVIFWDVKGRGYEPVQVLRDAKDVITSVQIIENEIFTASLDSRIRSYDIRAGKIITDFIGESITCLTLTRDGQCFLVSSSDDTIKLMDRTSGELLAEFCGHKGKDFLVENCVSSKDKYVMSGSADGNVYCWEIVSQKITKLLPHVTNQVVHSISAHPTEEKYLMATGSVILLWGEKNPDSDSET